MPRAPVLPVLLVLALPGAGLAQERPPEARRYDVRGALDGGPARGVLTLERSQAGLRLELRLEQGPDELRAWSGRGAREGGGWSFQLPPRTQGVAGALGRLGQASAPAGARALRLRRADAERLEVELVEAGRAAGHLAGVRLPAGASAPTGASGGPPDGPLGQCAPTADAWWARYPVAGWGIGRAVWDFYKPGSRRFEELRGQTTRDETRFLRLRLRGAPAPHDPRALFREARAVSQDDRSALELVLGLLIDEGHDLPLAPLPGIPAARQGLDKYEHFFASAVLAHRSNARGSVAVGWLKEAGDGLPGGTGFDEHDMAANRQGARFGQALLCP